MRYRRSPGVYGKQDYRTKALIHSRYFGTKQPYLSTLRLGDLSKCTLQIFRKRWGCCETANEDDFLAMKLVSRGEVQDVFASRYRNSPLR
jgi:hypothetical protein